MSAPQTIAGRFEIGDPERDLLGRGGMGLVYRATDAQTGQPVAVKALKPDVVADHPDLVARFVREGEALRQLDHPNIVKMVAAVEEDGQHYLVMEYVEGGDLRNLLEREGPLPVRRALEIGLEVADALTRAHHLHIIHRDLKPANVLLAQDGTPRLTDFGLARVADTPRLTQADVVMGTLDYLSPEACRGQELDPRTDIWAFGVLLYEMLTGQRPFAGDTAAATLLAILTEPVPELAEACPEVPDGMADLVYRMLEKDPLQRIPSVRLVGAELEAILQERKTTPSVPRPYQPSRFAAPTPQTGEHLHNLPAQPTPFVGRQAELAELDRLLGDPGVRLVTVLGPGGMGKTRLALETGATHLACFEHGVYFVPLAPLQSTDTILPTVADAVGYAFSSDAPGASSAPRQQLLDYLSQKHMLLIMDNFEHLLEGANLTGDILEAAPGVKILATSRARLNTRGEYLFRLTGMGFPDWETPEDALEYSSVKLFMQSARRVRPGFELRADDLTYVSRICRLVQGLPLGILLAAAWIEMLSPQEIADEIGKSLDFLETDMQDVPERQRSVRAVFETSWNTLSEREQEVLQALAVFRGGFTRQAAQQITGASLRELRALVDKSLVHRAPEGRYDIHELLRQYAEERLDHSPDAGAEARDSHCAHYAAALQRWFEDLKGPRQKAAIEEMGVEIENARAAWDWAAAHAQVARLSQAMDGLCHFYFRALRALEGQAITNAATKKLASASDSESLKAYVRLLGWQSVFTGRTDLAQRALDLLERPELAGQETRWERAFVLEKMGWRARGSDYERSRQLLAQSLALYRAIGDRWATASALYNLGQSSHEVGAYDEARQALEESLEIRQALGDQMGTATTLTQLSVTTWVQGHLEKSERLARESLEIYRQIDEPIGVVTGLLRISEALIPAGKFAESRASLEESIAIQDALHLSYNRASIHMLLGEAQIHLGQYDSARTEVQKGSSLFQRFGFGWGTGFAHFLVGLIDLAKASAYAEGSHAEAQTKLQTSAEVFKDIGHRENLGWALAVLAYVDRRLDQPDQARQHLAEALRIVADLGVFVPLMYGLPAAALLLADEGEHERAVEIYALASRYGFVANSRWFEDVAGQHIAQAAATLPPKVVAAAQERGQARDLDATARELLDEMDRRSS